ncbi:MAG TPA: hypothetical protein VGG33_11235 [Polyangia bacterium]
MQSLTGTVAPATDAAAGASTAAKIVATDLGAVDAALAEALLLSGGAAEELRAAILIGAASAKDLGAVLSACPNAVVLLVAPQARFVEALRAGESRADSPIDAERCFVASLPDEVEGGFPLAVLAELLAFLTDGEIAPSEVLVLGPWSAADGSAAAVAERAVIDLCQGFSRVLLADAVQEVSVMAGLLRSVGDFLFGVREHYHALKYYWMLYRAAKAAGTPDAHAGWRILECWAELGCSEWVEEWVQEPIFSEEFRGKIRDEVAPDLKATREFRRAAFAANLAALKKTGRDVDLAAPAGREIAQV